MPGPAELVLNGLLTSALLYFLLGLEPAIVTGVVLLTGLLVVLISLFARNPLIANPALPYVGLMLFGRAGQSVRVLHPSTNRYQSGNASVTIG